MRDVLVAVVGTIVSEDTGADATTGICTSAQNAQILRKSVNMHNVDTNEALRQSVQ